MFVLINCYDDKFSQLYMFETIWYLTYHTSFVKPFKKYMSWLLTGVPQTF